MLYKEILNILPANWSNMSSERYLTVDITDRQEIEHVQSLLAGHYFRQQQPLEIFRVQNPFLYAKFKHRKKEYERVGEVKIKTLYHDTGIQNADSICEYNFDWRLGKRFKYGPGVYFSKNPSLASHHSSKELGAHRAMFIVDVLVQNVQKAHGDIFLCDPGYDTVLAHNKQTYVKYFESDYYPKYFMSYVAKF